MRMKLRSRAATVVAGLWISSLGCRPEPAAGTPDATSSAPAAKETASIAPVDHPAQLLPASTVFCAVGQSPRRAIEVFARDAIAERFPELYRNVGGASTAVFGRDVFDPASWPAMGIDPDGHTGVAVLSVAPEVFALFVTLSDPPRFRETVLAIAARQGAELVPTSLGSGVEMLMDASGSAAVVLRGSYGVIVAGRGDELPRIVQSVATIDPGRALAGTLAYRKTVGATAPGDLIGFVDPLSILEQSSAGRAEQSSFNWAQEQVEEARARGDAPEQIAELEARAKEQDEWQARWRAREEAQAAIVQRLFSGVQGLSFRVDAKPSGAITELRMPLDDEAFLRRLLRPGKGQPALSWALDGAPVLFASGSFDEDAALELVDLFARVQGQTLAELTTTLENELQIDVSSLQDLLTGVVGGALTIDGKVDVSSFDAGGPSWLGFTVHAEVSDPAAMTKLLDAAAGKLRPFGKPLRRESGRAELSFEVPDWRRVYVTVAGRHLVVTTDRLLPERVAKGKAGNVEKKTKPAAAHGAMSLPDASFTFASEMALLGWSLFLGRSMTDFVAEASLESSDTASIPKSRTWQRKNKELDAARARLRKAEQALENEVAASTLDAIAPIGMTVLVAKLEEQGLWVTGGQFVRADGIPGAIVDVIAATQNMGKRHENPQSQEVSRLFEEVMRLQNELHEIRNADIERARSRKR